MDETGMTGKRRVIIDGKKTCTRCGELLDLDKFRVLKDGRYDSWCKPCNALHANKYYHNNKNGRLAQYYSEYKISHKEQIKLRTQKYQKTHKEKVNQFGKNYRDRIKIAFLEMYGGKCVCCGECNQEFLTIEHKNGQVGVKKKEKTYKAYRNAINELRPDIYEILCMNCNFSRGKFGYCPHQAKYEIFDSDTSL